MPTSPWFRREFDSLAVISHLTLELGNVSVFAATQHSPINTTSVVLQSASSGAAEAFRVHEEGHTLVLTWADGYAVDHDFTVEIHMPRESLDVVLYSGPDTVAIHPHTFRRSVDANLTIATTGPGSLLVDDTDLRAGSLHLRQGGAGLLQLSCRDIVVAYDVDVQTMASGSTVVAASSSVSASHVTVAGAAGHTTVDVQGPVKVTDFIDLHGTKSGHVDVRAHAMKSHHVALTTSGYGSVAVDATAQLDAGSVVDSDLVGHGSVRCTGAEGTCNALDINVGGTGSARINVAAITCSVAMDGKGSVYLRHGQAVQDEKIAGGGELKTFDESAEDAPPRHAIVKLVPLSRPTPQPED
ncbi:hypothetical protein DYB38_012048 [Aphanomyces astaci]|uniref:Uncharacterized protein n=1 Tax=Aphanomyces astaci TaxID=112090 RepID=A0A397DL53_APHAT|nr:hypothetical protein DYB38_012048 [Aphanomyces astaci]